MTAETGSAIGAKGLLIAAGVTLAVGGTVLWSVWPPSVTPELTEATAPVTAEPDTTIETEDVATAPAETEATAPDPQSGFDVVRVEPDGSAVIAGHAEPGSTIQLTLDGAPLENVEVGDDGNFVALLDIPTEEPGALGIATLNESGEIVEDSESAQTVLIAPTAPSAPAVETTDTDVAAETASPEAQLESTAAPAEVAETPEPQTAPQVLLADDQGIAVLQDGTGRPAVDNVVIDAITYDDAGEVALSGRAQSGSNLRVYLNNAPIEVGEVTESGQWRVPLPQVDSGVYTLRVDELAADGTVTSRTETPFKREEPSQLAAVANTQPDGPKTRVEAVTVQPGSTLWAIAREHLGEGPLYVRVFAANRDQIRNPDLIYPGQVFAIPDAQ